MPIDHFSIYVPQDKVQECEAFYLELLKPLGYIKKMQYGPFVIGMGPAESSIKGYDYADFWITGIENVGEHKIHLAFRANDHASVDAFYQAALKAGGKDNGAPGIRAYSHAAYYAAYVLDPLGNNIEAVCHTAQ